HHRQMVDGLVPTILRRTPPPGGVGYVWAHGKISSVAWPSRPCIPAQDSQRSHFFATSLGSHHRQMVDGLVPTILRRTPPPGGVGYTQARGLISCVAWPSRPCNPAQDSEPSLFFATLLVATIARWWTAWYQPSFAALHRVAALATRRRVA
ncbi:MAG: hypothetical protein ACK5S3_12675, partial [Pirellulaceae bacterium]